MPDFSIGVAVSHRLAVVETAKSQHEFILPDHLVCGITKLQDVVAPEVLRQIGLPPYLYGTYLAEVKQLLGLFEQFDLNPRQVRRALRERIGDGGFQRSEEDRVFHRSPESRSAFDRAEHIAEEKDVEVAAVQHLLAALLEIGETKTRELLSELNVDLDELLDAAAALPVAMRHTPDASDTPCLYEYGVDLTQIAREGKLSEVIGRKNEMLQVIRTLARDEKNNPVLVGDAGVGKTAIVEGIAYRIATSNIPPDFQNRRIIQINAGDLVRGTQFRGEFEERIRCIVTEASLAEDVILFIDEIHLLVGAGSGGGTMDAANLLKPALARGDIKLIGATTDDDYRRYVEKDTALERRFQPIRVEEPSPDETRRILQGIRERLETHHSVRIQEDAIEAAVQLSVRYLPNRRLPDKAIDLLRDGCAAVQYTNISYHPDSVESQTDLSDVVTANTIREVVAEQIGVPVAQLSEDQAKRVLKMEEDLRQRVVGQADAIEAIARAVRRNYAQLASGAKRPVGVFLFVGPTGVGKTELAKATADFLFGSDERMVRLDMSEYMEKHNVARLIGAPPGYVGFEYGGQLTEALRKTPYSVVLLDEVDKAHSDVLNIFLQAFGEGRLTDGQGRTVDASNAIFIMTSNLGYRLPDDKTGADETPPALPDYPPSREAIERAVYAHFRPEFLNRLDDTVFFHPLQPEQMVDVVRIQIKQLQGVLKDRYQIELKVDDLATEWLAEHGYSEQLGARPLIRLIDRELIDKIGGLLLRGQLKATHIVHVSLGDDQLEISYIGPDTI
jgi:ATP-dependent Clp protease ATP-binding subunit ClpC